MFKADGTNSRGAATVMAWVVIAIVSTCSLRAAQQEPAVVLKAIQVSFKLDSRLTDSTYGGERWVSPRTYTGANGQNTVDIRATGVDAKGTTVPIAPEWSVSDADMITVSPARGERVKITITRAGECTVKIASQGVVKELSVKASSSNNVLQIAIAQFDSKVVSVAPPDVAAATDPSKAPSPVELAEKNKREGEAFLAANAKRNGVVTLKSGLQYQILKTGKGPKPRLDSTVVCEYRAALVDGTRVSGTARNKPLSFPLKATIAAWREALQLMPAGSQWRLFVPPALAYGEKGAPRNRVGPNATLVFDIPLNSVADTPAAPKAAAPAAQVASAKPTQAAPMKLGRRRHR
jgi:FKBP-type peptidyl-prolyl cis-trans isomerase